MLPRIDYREVEPERGKGRRGEGGDGENYE